MMKMKILAPNIYSAGKDKTTPKIQRKKILKRNNGKKRHIVTK